MQNTISLSPVAAPNPCLSSFYSSSCQRQSYREVFFLTFIALATLWILALARIILYSPSDACRRFAWGVSGGSVTGFQNFLKDALTVFKASAQNKSNVDTTPQQPRPYGLLALLVGLSAATAFGGLLLLTSCMKRYDATYSSAMFVGSFVIMASVMSVVHYDTLNHLDGVINLVLYPIGLCILMLGVYILTGTNATVDSSGDVGRHSPSQMPLIVVRVRIVLFKPQFILYLTFVSNRRICNFVKG